MKQIVVPLIAGVIYFAIIFGKVLPHLDLAGSAWIQSINLWVGIGLIPWAIIGTALLVVDFLLWATGVDEELNITKFSIVLRVIGVGVSPLAALILVGLIGVAFFSLCLVAAAS